eukprot:2467735-Amphidinium_carterae.2
MHLQSLQSLVRNCWHAITSNAINAFHCDGISDCHNIHTHNFSSLVDDNQKLRDKLEVQEDQIASLAIPQEDATSHASTYAHFFCKQEYMGKLLQA